MKKGINVHADYDGNGRWRLNIDKQRGRLTLDEIMDAAREWEWDYYILILDCFYDPDDFQFVLDEGTGDHVELYRTDLFREEGEK